ncbi:thioredoxin [bacterium]|jgi:thioredoxin 1|nr:thioredoxin [bacterium]
MIISITKDNIEKEVTNSKLPVVMDVYAPWCGPCQHMLPIFEELAKEMEGKCIFVKLNVDEARDLSIQYGVTSVPTFIFIKNNEVKGRDTGYKSKEDLKEIVEKFIEQN